MFDIISTVHLCSAPIATIAGILPEQQTDPTTDQFLQIYTQINEYAQTQRQCFVLMVMRERHEADIYLKGSAARCEVVKNLFLRFDQRGSALSTIMSSIYSLCTPALHGRLKNG